MANILIKKNKKSSSKEIVYALTCYYYSDTKESQLNVLDLDHDDKRLMEIATKHCQEYINEQDEDIRSQFKITVGDKKVTVSIPDEDGQIPCYDSDYRDHEKVEVLDYMLFQVHTVGEHTDEENMYKYYHVGSEKMGKERREEYVPSSSSDDSDSEEDNEEGEEK